MFLTHRIEEIVVQSTDTRRAIGEFVLRERSHLADYTIGDIAEATFSSKPSVTRFAKALGYSGWRDFIRDFVAEVHFEESHQTAVDPNYPFAAGDADETVINAVADAQFDAVADTMRLLNRGAIALGARYLQHAKCVHVFGVSPNTYLGELFCRKLLSVGKTAHVASPDENGVVARSLTSDDCAVIISYSGNNPAVNPMQVVPTLLANKVPTIAITGEGENYLRHNVRCTLTISSRETLYDKISTFGTEASILFLLNALFGCYFARAYERNKAFKTRSAQALEQSREAAGIER
ncbi:MurR/RpiR family transcriptional regulator [Collinsella sp. An2]|uniref:MurR/RpiR family transcriptional regulator n=1 Tax=Collinsella sp. An2 TaxID=1965585 RepID=UPI000B38AA2F|nr:MurR/RpiR family transcriptional regulator [Collinsella sp. An2]OUP10842.1 hypothetical protein B5F33_00145 [Collinsella sp. An2]